MSAILYPVAETTEQALHAPLAFVAREREAREAAGGAVIFVSESVGPAFVSEAAAMQAYAASALAPGDWRTLRPVVESAAAPGPLKPVNRDGRRWAAPKPGASTTLWRLSISYWRIVRETAVPVPPEAARRLRRDPAAEGLDPRALQALAHQPLRAAAPQRALDIGLFEVRLPENPGRIMPDE